MCAAGKLRLRRIKLKPPERGTKRDEIVAIIRADKFADVVKIGEFERLRDVLENLTLASNL